MAGRRPEPETGITQQSTPLRATGYRSTHQIGMDWAMSQQTTGYNAREREAEIARLTAENARLREALATISHLRGRGGLAEWAADQAREALST